MEKTCKSGAGADEVYTPSLWYFEMLDFLRNQECQSPGISTIDLEDEEFSIDEATEVKETFVGGTKKRTVNQQLTERNNLLREAVHQLKARPQTETKDEAALYSEAWGSTYRKLSPGQQIFARRAIDEVLVLGQLELLTFDSFRTASRTSSTSSTPQFSPSLSSSPVQYAVHYAPNMEAPQTTTNRTFSRTSSTTSTPQFSPSLSSSPVQYAVHYVPNKQTPQTPTNAMFVVGPEEEAYENIQQLFDDPKFN